jgi:2-methylisocitrate lyase-like PEP mutase family enzyme
MASATQLGMPDAGLLTLTEHVNYVSRIASSVNIPVLVDADDGYGNANNVIRTVREFERAGVAGIHLEDQQNPKRSVGYPGARPLVDLEVMVGKLRAAVFARKDPDFVFVARTDALDVSVDLALERAHAYAEAGADAVLPISKNLDRLKEFASRWNGARPLVLAPNWFPSISAAEWQAAGVSLIFRSHMPMLAAYKAVADVAREIVASGRFDGVQDRLMLRSEIERLMGFPELIDQEKQFVVTPTVLRGACVSSTPRKRGVDGPCSASLVGAGKRCHLRTWKEGSSMNGFFRTPAVTAASPIVRP